MSKIKIENVDEGLLKQQINSLAIILDTHPIKDLGNSDHEACEGILNMLEAWSDSICKEVSVKVYEWVDKVNGNSYFSARVWIEGALAETLPFHYGYGENGIETAINKAFPDKRASQAYWRYCKDNNITLLYSKETKLKREVKKWGEKDA